MTPEQRAHLVKARALALGFDAAGVTDVSPPPHADQLIRWLDQGQAGTMTYMHRQRERRLRPAEILPGATRAVVVTKHYLTPEPEAHAGTGRVAKYARGRDYHAALRGPLTELADYIRSLGPEGTIAKAYCDAGPVPERELAQRAGLGWIGKNTMLIDPGRGSYSFIATVLTSLELATDLPFEADRCGTCRRCLDACPTAAFPGERVLDSRRCISYLTIEHRGPIDPTLAQSLEGWVFGCDICQDVCPWNHKFAKAPTDQLLAPDAAMAVMDLQEVAQLSDDEFERRFAHTALARAGPEGIRRNARLGLQNESGELSGDRRSDVRSGVP